MGFLHLGFKHSLLQWVPEIKSFCSENKHDLILIIVGTELQKRKPGKESVTKEEGKQMARRVSAAAYIESSNDQVFNNFIFYINAALPCSVLRIATEHLK